MADTDTIKRPCHAVHPDPVLTAHQCRLCHLYETRPDYRELWGGDPADIRHTRKNNLRAKWPRLGKKCPHLGAKVPGKPCGSTLYTCNFDNTVCSTLNPCVGAKRCCQTCPYHPAATQRLSILITAGIGDAFAVESMLTPEDRERLETIYYSCPSWREIRAMFTALPNYPRLSTHVIVDHFGKVRTNLADVVRHNGPLPEDVEDWSISRVFSRNLPYTGSSFLNYTVASVVLPDRPYVTIIPHSTWGRWNNRGFNDADWNAALTFLADHDLVGVVLCREKLRIPAHSRLLDWQGKHSILESIEILKGGMGYLGIDSCFSVLAAKQFPASRLAIKSVSGHCYANKHNYYAPRTEFNFLADHLKAPEWY